MKAATSGSSPLSACNAPGSSPVMSSKVEHAPQMLPRLSWEWWRWMCPIAAMARQARAGRSFASQQSPAVGRKPHSSFIAQQMTPIMVSGALH